MRPSLMSKRRSAFLLGMISSFNGCCTRAPQNCIFALTKRQPSGWDVRSRATEIGRSCISFSPLRWRIWAGCKRRERQLNPGLHSIRNSPYIASTSAPRQTTLVSCRLASTSMPACARRECRRADADRRLAAFLVVEPKLCELAPPPSSRMTGLTHDRDIRSRDRQCPLAGLRPHRANSGHSPPAGRVKSTLNGWGKTAVLRRAFRQHSWGMAPHPCTRPSACRPQARPSTPSRRKRERRLRRRFAER